MPLSLPTHFFARSRMTGDRTQPFVLYNLRVCFCVQATDAKFSQFAKWHKGEAGTHS
ncbi:MULTISPECIES: hypothetical protein [unclassified Microcoleus]|uniref:hypothetical protein n=1 Tax=unclassified Microcoleus TaxID=2642155 RepID=UPI0025FD835B|nr:MULTISPECIES: hypothetical protein [unclassified Microcoleus]